MRCYANTNHPPATPLPSLWLRCLKSIERSCLRKPHNDTQLCPTPMAAWAEADRQLMTLDEGFLQTASWISHHLPLTCALIQSEPASAASRGPGRLCKLRNSRLMQRHRMSRRLAVESGRIVIDGGSLRLACGLCRSVNIFDGLESSNTLQVFYLLDLSLNQNLCILWAVEHLPCLWSCDPTIQVV